MQKKWMGLLSLMILVASCSVPVAQFKITNEDVVAPVEVSFQNESQNADRYEWDFGDGATSDEVTPTHRYTGSGNFEVRLKAYKGNTVKETRQRILVRPPDNCLVEVQTSFGNMLIELFDETPLHRDNFTKLAEEGFYDSLTFHRVMEGFMIQGGDPNSKEPSKGRVGNGGPGYTIPAEFNSDLIHLPGMVAAARTPDNVNPEKRSSGSQFYIVQGKPVTKTFLERIEQTRGFTYSPTQKKVYLELGGTPQLDMEYTVFGRVVDGLEVIDKIASVKTNKTNRPDKPVRMKVVLIK